MFKLLLVTVLLGLAAAADVDKDAEIRSLKNDPADAEGNFAYAFDTTNGIAIQESGNIAGATGAVSYISPEGVKVDLTYTADQDGYHPAGAHLPVGPPIPELILKSLAYIASHPQYEERQPKIGSSIPFRG